MARQLVIGSIKVKMGETKRINLHLSTLPTNIEIVMPVFVFRGKKTGPTVLFTGGIHGDEVVGIEIIRRLVKDKLIVLERGSVIAIPLVDIFGFLMNSRRTPENEDINRSFPGDKEGTLAERIAHLLVHKILHEVDFGIDFHGGGENKLNYPQLRCSIEDSNEWGLAQAFCPPFIVNTPRLSNSFRSTAANLGKQILVFEGGESYRLAEPFVQEGINGALRLMNHKGMISREIPAPTSKSLSFSYWVRASKPGIFFPGVKLSEKVKKHQNLGTLIDPFGEYEEIISAPYGGYVIGLSTIPLSKPGDPLIHLGTEKTEKQNDSA